MIRKVRDQKGTALIIWILLAAVLVMVVLIMIPVIGQIGESGAAKEDEAHEQTCLDSVYMEWPGGGYYDVVYDYEQKRFVGLTEHPYQVQPYGSTKAHQDCVILVHGEGASPPTLTWISRTALRERYR